MGTKLKSLASNFFVKALCILLISIAAAVVVKAAAPLPELSNYRLQSYFEPDYIGSARAEQDVNDMLINLETLLRYKSVTYLQSKEFITEGMIKQEKDDLYNSYLNSYTGGYADGAYNSYARFENFEKAYAYEIENIPNRIAEQYISQFQTAQHEINKKSENIEYYATNGQEVFKNGSEDKQYYLGRNLHYVNDSESASEINAETTSDYNVTVFARTYYNLENENYKLYFAVSDKYAADYEKELEIIKSIINKFLTITGVAAAIALFCFITLTVGIKGRLKEPDENGKYKISFLSRIYTEIYFLLLIPVWLIFYAGMVGIGDLGWYDSFRGYVYRWSYSVQVNLLMAIIGITMFCLLLIYSCFVKKLKEKVFLKKSFVGDIFALGTKGVRKMFSLTSLTVKIVFMLLAACLLFLFTVIMLTTDLYGANLLLMLLVFASTILYFLALAFFISKQYTILSNGVKEIRNGKTDTKIEVKGKEFKVLADDINSIGDGISAAVEAEIKSERMKTELITNVSHDIRTPLTSIIAYADLLENEGLQSEKAHEYLKVIISKGQRLKSLTDNLFDLSKATSKNLIVSFESLSLKELISQILIEFEDDLSEKELETVVNVDSIKILADSQLSFRIIENLLTNITKYSLKGSRIYIDAERIGGSVKIIFKNISSTALNINSEELTERFIRGDSARNTEGNGLGLSIVKSFAEAMNGSFGIEVDGDLFKAVWTVAGVY